MMPPPPLFPSRMTVDALFNLHCWMIENDPQHLAHTTKRLGRKPTRRELAEHWFNNGAETFEKIVVALAAKNGS